MKKNLEKILIKELSVNSDNANFIFEQLQKELNPQQQVYIDFLKKCYRKSELTSTTDELTGLGNRRALKKGFDKEYSRFKRTGKPFSVIELDIDYFGKFNNKYGHDVGDEVLKKFTDVISENIRPTDGFYRHGGEEFYLILPNETKRTTYKAISKLRKKIQECNVAVGNGRTSNITFSAGAYLVEEENSIDDSLKKADSALYEAKENGRNQIRLHYKN